MVLYTEILFFFVGSLQDWGHFEGEIFAILYVQIENIKKYTPAVLQRRFLFSFFLVCL